jgi:hypothetical protein
MQSATNPHNFHQIHNSAIICDLATKFSHKQAICTATLFCFQTLASSMFLRLIKILTIATTILAAPPILAKDKSQAFLQLVI